MIQSQAMLANVTISQWTARKHDKAVSDEVDKLHLAQEGGRYNKLLISKTALDPLSKHAGQTREYHYRMTLPWGDNGDRLLPAALYLEYTTQMRKLKDQFESLAQDFALTYPSLIDESRIRLGSMYNANDYPPVGDIQARFNIGCSFLPVPDAKDFRVDVGNEALEEIRASITNANNERQKSAVKECWDRLENVVAKFWTKMNENKPVFRDSIVENIADLVKMLPKLNIANDSALNQVCATIDNTLLIFMPAQLRRSSAERLRAAIRAELVLQSIHHERG